jgi:hypothetical protein
MRKTEASARKSSSSSKGSTSSSPSHARQQSESERDRVKNEPRAPSESREQHVEVEGLAVPPHRGEHESRDSRRDGETYPELPKAGTITGAAPDKEARRDQSERDDDVDRAAPRRKVGPSARE